MSVAAGFSPLAIGTETGGSNVFPASVSGCYGLTLTRQAVASRGVFCISESFDRIGVMARDPWSLASLTEVLLSSPSVATPRSEVGYSPSASRSWMGCQSES